jgi:predicted alpha/beta-hydrolase family hydrolase
MTRGQGLPSARRHLKQDGLVAVAEALADLFDAAFLVGAKSYGQRATSARMRAPSHAMQVVAMELPSAR